MVSAMVAQIHLFGALRKFGSEGVLTLEFNEPCSVREIRELLKEKLAREFPLEFQGALIDRAALANDKRVLAEDEQIKETARLSLLPPVCGG